MQYTNTFQETLTQKSQNIRLKLQRNNPQVTIFKEHTNPSLQDHINSELQGHIIKLQFLKSYAARLTNTLF
jgi:hypothetical protein